MINQATLVKTEYVAKQGVYWLGYGSALLTAVASAAALGIAITTAPARSGPFCSLEWVDVCVTYPYTDAVAYVPNDYLWMYPAFLIGPLFVVLTVCIHHYAPPSKKVFSHSALIFAAMAATALAINYYIRGINEIKTGINEINSVRRDNLAMGYEGLVM